MTERVHGEQTAIPGTETPEPRRRKRRVELTVEEVKEWTEQHGFMLLKVDVALENGRVVTRVSSP